MFSLNSNIDKVIERFKGYQTKLKEVDPSEALIVGVNAAKGKMSFRIFNEGKDIGGVSFGSYGGKRSNLSKKKVDSLFAKKKRVFFVGEEEVPSNEFTEYELKRIKAGRQIRYKDLEFTGTLRRGIVVIKENNTSVVCLINNDKLVKIAQYQEEAIGGGEKAVIFTLSEEERQLMRDNITEALKQIYARVFNS